jgi:hypothetical protein
MPACQLVTNAPTKIRQKTSETLAWEHHLRFLIFKLVIRNPEPVALLRIDPETQP